MKKINRIKSRLGKKIFSMYMIALYKYLKIFFHEKKEQTYSNHPETRTHM